VGSRTVAHVPYREGLDTATVRVTEGALKADIATRLSGTLTIGLPGVHAWKMAAGVLQALGAKVARVAYDADACHNRHVAESLARLVKHLRRRGLVVEMEVWDKADGKGIDDLLTAGKVPDVVTGEAVDSVVAQFLKDAQGANPPPSALAPPGKVNEADDDPHRLARGCREGWRAGGVDAFHYWREEYHRWERGAYRVVLGKEVRAELTGHIKREFDRLNLLELGSWRQRQAEGAGDGGGEGGGRKKKKSGPPEARRVDTKLVSDALQALNHLSLLPGSLTAPCWLGGDGPFAAAEVLACRNALVHLPSLIQGREPCLVPPTPHFFSQNALDYDFDPGAPEPVAWLAFLRQLWPDDSEAIDTLQEWFGYMLLPDTSQQKILFVVGPRRSGKGTIARVLQALVGIDNTTSPTLAGLATNFGL
jgi:putative DNA primase/helicase